MKKKFKKSLVYLLLCLIILGVFNAYFNFILPIKSTGYSSTLNIASTPKNISWPKTGEAAAGIVGQELIISNNPQIPSQTASTAKLITILSVLKVHPLKINQDGPTITITQQDLNIYNQYVREQGSVVPVQLGEKLSQYQVMQAMLLPSANNLADALAIWAFGSLSNYANYANNFLKLNGINQTHVGKDASGLDPSTTSTASDLVKIGEMAIQNPVIAQIVATKQVTNFPVVGNFSNLNFLLGQNGVIGIKTGNTDQAGGVFVSASIKEINNKPVTIVTAVMKSKDLMDALTSSSSLIESLQNEFQKQTFLSNKQTVAYVKLPWGQKVGIHLKTNIAGYSWINEYQTIVININPIKVNTNSNEIVGTASLKKNFDNTFSSYNLYLNQTIKPPLKWILLHINY